MALIHVGGGIKQGQRRQREAFAVILHQSVICPCIIGDVVEVEYEI